MLAMAPPASGAIPKLHPEAALFPPSRASLARENFKRAGVDNLVTLVMGDAHETVKKFKDPIDILFIDADKEGYTDYLEKLLPLVRPGGLILAHNIDQVGRDFINAITTNPNLETIQLEGVTVTLKKQQSEKTEETSAVD